mgnify:CR=1 FL=1
MKLEVRNLVKRFGKTLAVDDLSFTITNGEVLGFIGPNGSGKSNIADAILWVMGEQRSKTLRGGKMEDVIFGGTEKRGALGFAQVSLIIDNSAHIFDFDGTELMLTRRYYRSGESEYYINRESVRLKDINSLLMDTGLGRDGYSIIGQGRIAEIVSNRSTDRREVFEEAAGISRYRSRKEESERKLAKTEENLVCRPFIDTVEDASGALQTIRFFNEDNFNFAYDVVDALGTAKPDKLAMLHICENGEERRFTFGDMKKMSARAANYFRALGVKRGDCVMLVMRRNWEFWPVIVGLNKLGAIAIPATDQLVEKDLAKLSGGIDVEFFSV